ncbi:hypothetical protein TNCV_5006681 [Trichonephila clavipes]|uniref:Uncharacterized protein n=1 Tax=Trichonephila clavipes TaxID=2585209 RepID=A0A8X6SCC2_TRICX|nr:hypothetical protein TNCV_5006681 [Trichonephila clavipes]
MLLNIGGGRASGIVVSEADYGAVGAGFESRVRHGCLLCNSPLCDVCLTLTSISLVASPCGCGSILVKISDRGWHAMSSSLIPLKYLVPPCRGVMHIKICRKLKRPPVGVVVRRGVPVQVSSSSLDHGSKLWGLSLKAFLQ